MKTFFLLRLEDVSGMSGCGVVAEGVVFDNGIAVMTWLTEHSTVTMFPSLKTVMTLHSHEGRTELVLEGKHKRKFDECKEIAKLARLKAKNG